MWLRDMHVDGLRLDAVHALVDERATHVLEEMAQEVDKLSVAVGRPLTLIAESDLNDPRMVTPRVAGGMGLDRAVERRLPPRAARDAHRRGPGLLRRLRRRRPRRRWPRSLTGAFFHDGAWSSFRRRHHGRPVDTATPARLEVPRLPAGPRPDRQPRRRRPDLRDPLPRPARRRRDAGAHQPLHPDAVHGRGVGREHAVAVLHQPPRAGAGQGHGRGPDRRVRRARLGRRRRPRPAGPRDLHALEARLVGAVARSRTSGCSRVHRSLLALRRAHPDLVDPDLSAVAGQLGRRRPLAGGPPRLACGWSSNLADQPREIDLDVAPTEVLFATGELPSLDGATVTLRAGERRRPQHPLTCAGSCRPGRRPGRRRPGRRLPAARGPLAAGQLRRLPRRRDHRRGRSGGLGSPGDRRVFRLLRALADVVLVGHGTAAAEGYGPVTADSPVGRLRAELGRPPTAPIAVVSRRASLDPDSRLVTDAVAPTCWSPARPLTPAGGRRWPRPASSVLVCGDDDVDLPARARPARRPRAGAGALRGRARSCSAPPWRRASSTSWTCRSRRRSSAADAPAADGRSPASSGSSCARCSRRTGAVHPLRYGGWRPGPGSRPPARCPAPPASPRPSAARSSRSR